MFRIMLLCDLNLNIEVLFHTRSDEEQEFGSIVNAIEAYDAKRWREGKAPSGKG